MIFDEAQRAWDRAMASRFMRTKRGRLEFDQSEPEYLISVMDRHDDWAVIVCLVGSGQEIHTGEAGIDEWFRAISARFPHWRVYAPSPASGVRFNDDVQDLLTRIPHCTGEDSLHLRAVSYTHLDVYKRQSAFSLEYEIPSRAANAD